MLNLKKDTGLFVLIIVVGTVVALINPLFVSSINIANTANLVGLFGMFAIAQAFVIITGGIELSVGSMIALLGVIFVDLIANLGVPWQLAAPLVLAIGFVLGLGHGLLITKKHMQPFVVTLCGLLIYRGVARFYTEDATAGFPFGVRFEDLEFITTGRTDLLALLTGGAMKSISLPHSFFLMLLLAAIMWMVLHRSVFGRYLYAVGKNEEAARFSGIRTDRVVIAAYVICGVLTALSAIFLAMYTRSILPSSHGNFYELYAIAAAVLGGFSLRGGEGSIVGVVLGTILLQILQNLVNLLGIPSSLNFAVSGSVILIGVLADQEYAAFRKRRALVRSRLGGQERAPDKVPQAAEPTS
jgi:ribose transport system permease protein